MADPTSELSVPDNRAAGGAGAKMSDDLLVGVPAISDYLGEDERAVRHQIDLGALPCFKLPGSDIWRMRKSTHLRLVERLEAEQLGRAKARGSFGRGRPRREVVE